VQVKPNRTAAGRPRTCPCCPLEAPRSRDQLGSPPYRVLAALYGPLIDLWERRRGSRSAPPACWRAAWISSRMVPRRSLDRTLHAAPPAPGAAPLPERDRAPDPGQQGDPRDPRQLRRARAPERPQVPGPAPALGVPSHPNLVLVAERDRGFFARVSRRRLKRGNLPFAGRAAGSDQPLHRAPQPDTPPVHLEGRSQSDHRRRQARASNVGDNPLVSTPWDTHLPRLSVVGKQRSKLYVDRIVAISKKIKYPSLSKQICRLSVHRNLDWRRGTMATCYGAAIVFKNKKC
jgi:hypothetical protein